MELLIGNDVIKGVIFQATNFVTNNPLLTYVNDWLLIFLYHFVLVFRVAATIFFRLFFGVWLKCFNVVPFQICEKNKYYEDPGVLEMRALLRGEDCFDTFLDQQQKLPFPPLDFDPFDKVYLAIHFSQLQRALRNLHENLTQRDISLYQRISNTSVFQSFLRYLLSRVAVNVDH